MRELSHPLGGILEISSGDFWSLQWLVGTTGRYLVKRSCNGWDGPTWQNIILSLVWPLNVLLHIQVGKHPTHDYLILESSTVQCRSTKYFLHGFHIQSNVQECNNDENWGKIVFCFIVHFITSVPLFQKIISLTIHLMRFESSMQYTCIRADHVLAKQSTSPSGSGALFLSNHDLESRYLEISVRICFQTLVKRFQFNRPWQHQNQESPKNCRMCGAVIFRLTVCLALLLRERLTSGQVGAWGLVQAGLIKARVCEGAGPIMFISLARVGPGRKEGPKHLEWVDWKREQKLWNQEAELKRLSEKAKVEWTLW